MATPKPRTIAHVVTSLEVGGLERVVVDLVLRLDPDRYRSVVCCLDTAGPLAEEIVERAGAARVMHRAPGKSYSLWPRLARWFREERVDIVHAHNFGPLLYGSVAARLAGSPAVIYTLHGPGAAERADYRRLERLGLIRRIVAVSDHVRDVAMTTGGIPAGRIVTIRNGVDTEHFHVADDGVRERTRHALGLEDGHVAIIVVARLTHEKDHAGLLDAFSQVLESHSRARLILVGDGPLRESLEMRAAELGVMNATAFLGTRSDIPELLSACDLFVLPSLIEGLGITLLEAMSAGLATVATTAGGIPEIVDDTTGRSVSSGDSAALADAIRWMLDHPDEARAMGERGRRRAIEEFGVAAMVRRYQAIYDEVGRRGRQ